jgi:hypothetical protein
LKYLRQSVNGMRVAHDYSKHGADPIQGCPYCMAIKGQEDAIARLQEEIAKREEAIAHGKLLQESAWNLGVATGKKESESRAAALQKDKDALIAVIDAVMNIPNMTDAQLEQLKANCRAALSKESK